MYAFHDSTIGSSHLETGKPCQDASLSRSTDTYAIGVVADGHGGQSYIRSGIGARKACKVTMSVLREFLHSTSCMKFVPSGVWQQQIAGSIISRWQDVISRHKDNHPITESEWALLTDKDKTRYEQGQWQFIYGTTLIAIVRTRTAFLGIQIGDGRCVTIGSDSQCRQPIPWDKDCFLNHTTSLCDSSAIRKFRFVFKTRNLPVAAFIGTDGVDDSLGTDERLEDFYLRIWWLLQTDKKNAVHFIRDFLPDMSAKGSRDDISIAGICYDNT